MNEHPIIVDLDDFTGSAADVARLCLLRQAIPEFRVTLFTIPGLTTPERVATIRRNIPWIDLVAHGWMHETSRECEHWTHAEMLAYLDKLEAYEFTRGWKAPGWLLSDGCYAALLERGYWLADQAYNRDRRPPGLKFYEINRHEKVHGHLGHLGGRNQNELEVLAPGLLRLSNREFGFVRDYLAGPRLHE